MRREAAGAEGGAVTTEVKASAMQIDEEALRDLLRDEMSEGHSRRLRFDGTVNLGHVLTGIGMIAGMFWTYSTFDKRLVLVETQLSRQTEIMDRSIRADEQLRAIRERLEKLERPR